MGTRRFRIFLADRARFPTPYEWVEQFRKICFGVGVMMSNRNRRKIARLAVERLEERAVPATFGVPWADPEPPDAELRARRDVDRRPTELVVPDAQRPAADRRLAAGDPSGLPDLGRPGEHQHRPGDRRRRALRRRRPIPARPAVRRYPRRHRGDGSRLALDLGAQRPHALEHLGRRRSDQLERRLRQRRLRPHLGLAARGRSRLRSG